MGLVVLVGVSGSGKRTFAAQHFTPWQVVSSDFCRGLVADDANDQTRDQGRLRRAAVHRRHPAAARAAHRRRRHQRPEAGPPGAGQAGPGARRAWSTRSCSTYPSRSPSSATPSGRTGNFGAHVVARQHRDLKRRCAGSARRASGGCTCCTASRRSRPPRSRTEKSWNDRRDLTGPFDIVGDVHGCASRAAHAADRARLAARVRRRRPRGRRDPPRGPHRGVRRRPRRPRPGHAGRAAAGHGHGRRRHRAVRLRQPRGEAGARAQGRQGPGQPTASPSRSSSWPRSPRSSGPRRWRSWTA